MFLFDQFILPVSCLLHISVLHAGMSYWADVSPFTRCISVTVVHVYCWFRWTSRYPVQGWADGAVEQKGGTQRHCRQTESWLFHMLQMYEYYKNPPHVLSFAHCIGFFKNFNGFINVTQYDNVVFTSKWYY